jgi:hypothetical protein
LWSFVLNVSQFCRLRSLSRTRDANAYGREYCNDSGKCDEVLFRITITISYYNARGDLKGAAGVATGLRTNPAGREARNTPEENMPRSHLKK